MEGEKISEYEDRAIQNIQNEIQKYELKIIKRVTELCDNFKQSNICGTGVQEGVVIWYRQKKIFELIMATFSKFDDNY